MFYKLKNVELLSSFVKSYNAKGFDLFKELDINIYPAFNGNSEQMSFTLSHVGLLPILKLQIAGYRVAYEMLNNQITSISQPI
jgi:hypothetical protein